MTLLRATLFACATALAVGCGAGSSSVGTGPSAKDGGSTSVADAGTGKPSSCQAAETCGDGIDNNCDGQIDEGFDKDGDTYKTCLGDCDDNNPLVHPGATETANQVDDNCDGKVDNQVAGGDYDKDGTPFPTDCNDDEPLVGPLAVEVGGDNTDNNCDGKVDEAVTACDDSIGVTASDFAKAIGLCGASLTQADFSAGDVAARKIRAQFGSKWLPKQGSKMVMLSSGKAKDLIEDTAYRPQSGFAFGKSATHPLYSPPRCGGGGTTVPTANDLTEFKVTLKVPQNAKSFSYQFNFFSAEYPEYVCTEYNDRFIALMQSTALDKSKLPTDQCTKASGAPQCNISYDDKGQPVTINNGFFDVCVSAKGTDAATKTPWENKCSKPISLLQQTGYDKPDPGFLTNQDRIAGGATGWLTTKAPVTPGETITLRFIIFDEGDDTLDSAVLIDNFTWEATPVAAPETVPGLN